MNSQKKIIRLAGFLYLILIICGVFAEFFIRSKFHVHGDAIATAKNIINSTLLYRLGFVSDLMMLVSAFFLVLTLYVLLHSINKRYAVLMVCCILIGVAITCTNMLNHAAPFLLLSGADYLNVFEVNQLYALVVFFLKMHAKGYLIAQIFFGLWLFPLGYLVFKSGFLPKTIGIFLMLGCLGYLIDFFKKALFPDYESIILSLITIPADIGEFSLCFWLLFMGLRKA